MGRVVEQRPSQQPDDPRDEPQPTGPGAPTPPGSQPADSAAIEPAQPQLDPEQLRQFQQFQQFQDFLRYTEAQRQGNGQLVPTQNAPIESAPGYGPPTQSGHGGPPAPPPPYGPLQPAPLPQPPPKIKAPRWAKRLAGKLLSALLFLIVLIAAGAFAYNYFFPEDDPDLPASQTGGGTYHTNEILSVNPYEAARQVYQQVAQGQPDRVCGLFETGTQQKFAADLQYPDCREAVLNLKKQVTNMTAYAGSLPFGSTQPVQGTVVRIDSCDYQISGGPALGVFVVTKVGDQWLITGHEPGPRTCVPSGTPTSR